MTPPRFHHFAAIDWSGAAGERQAGIALAICDADGGAPWLVRPGHRWSRGEVLGWLLGDMPADTLVGLDLGASLPFVDHAAFFPGWAESPSDAKALWALVEAICANDPHLGATSLVDHPQLSAFFRRHGGREGALFGKGGAPGGQGRFRVTEAAQAAMGCRPTSNFNLVGAAQVGKSSLTGMRVLHRLAGRLPVWPFDPLPDTGSVVVEIYTSLAAIAAGRRAGRSKMRDAGDLTAALAALGSPPALADAPVSDHAADALLTATWLRVVADDPELWSPPALTTEIARAEGWTFGAR
ncbi:MAG: hypothetical protein ABIT04_10415 [Novosphingobium sp.]